MSIRRTIAMLALVAFVSVPLGAAGPKTKYERIVAQEKALRLGRRPSPLSQIRKVVVAYETVARQHPTSGYADNALWQGASLSLNAYRIFQSEQDRTTAARLLQWLVDQYPSSSLKAEATQALRKAKPAAALAKHRAAPSGASASTPTSSGGASTSASATSAANLASVKALADYRAEEAAAAKAAAEREAAERRDAERRETERRDAERREAERREGERREAERRDTELRDAQRRDEERRAAEGLMATAPAATMAAVTPASATAGTSAAPGSATTHGGVTLTDVTRMAIGDLVRVTMFFDGEVEYKQDRIERPARLYFDIKKVQTSAALQDAVLTYNDSSVKNIRLGRPRLDTTRLVIDLDGVASYNVFTQNSPYRLVVDLRRAAKGAKTSVAKDTSAKPETTLAAAAVIPKPTPIPTPSTPASSGTTASSSAARAPETDRRIPPRPLPHPLASAAAPSVATRAVTEVVDAPMPLLASGTPVGIPASAIAHTALSSPRIAAAFWQDPKKAAARQASMTARTDRTERTDTKVVATRQPTTVEKVTPPPPGRTPTTVARVTPPPPLPSREAPTGKDVQPPAIPAANSAGGFSLSRQLGLGVSRIVIDPGHGGHDVGSMASKAQEKEIVLDVALRLEKLLRAEPGFDVVMTRKTDVFIPLEERTAIANRHQADLFLSIHTNSSRNKQAGGVETYYLNFASNPEAEEVAARENAGASQTMNHLPEIVKAIALNNKLDESRDLAHLVQDAMVSGLRSADHAVPNRGVKQAPFVVLIGASMPSVLAEISFITNANDGSLMKTGAYRQKIAESLFAAVRKYQRSLKNVGTMASQVTLDDEDR